MNTKCKEKISVSLEENKISGNEIVVNYHMNESCNYRCHYCYAKWGVTNTKAELHNDLAEVKRMLIDLYDLFTYQLPYRYPQEFGDWKNIRLNLVGGEPTLSKNFGEIITIARQIGYKIGIVTNGSFLDEEFVLRFANDISVMGISVDAAQEDLMIKIGRSTRSGKVLDLNSLIKNVNLLRSLNPQIKIKVNTVVNKYNYDHDMSDFIKRIEPDKWKIFKVLPNINPEAEITDDQFYRFLDSHKQFTDIMFPEDNDLMTGSYIMVDPLGRFFDNTCSKEQKGYLYSKPITEVGAFKAFQDTNISMEKFRARY